MRNLPFIIGIVVIFTAGLISGFFLGSRPARQETIPVEETQQTAVADEQTSLEDRIIKWMYDYLEINDEQEIEIRPLVQLAITEYQELETQHRSAIHTLIDHSDQRIAKHLTNTQAEKLFKHSSSNR